MEYEREREKEGGRLRSCCTSLQRFSSESWTLRLKPAHQLCFGTKDLIPAGSGKQFWTVMSESSATLMRLTTAVDPKLLFRNRDALHHVHF